MMVERRWPTCISLATFGEEKSTTTRLGAQGGGIGPCRRIELTVDSRYAGATKMLMKPGPATSHRASSPSVSQSVICAASFSATALGLAASAERPASLSALKSGIAVLF